MSTAVADKGDKLDDLVYRLERLVVVASLMVMSIVVFLDVLHRTFASEENKFVGVLAKVLGLFGSETIDRGSSTYTALETAAPIVLWVGFVWLAYFGIRTAAREVEIAPHKALVYAVLGVVASYGLVRLMIVVMPNGFIWSQSLALVLTLWVGFFGASMCTHDNKHLRVEAVQRHLPDSLKPTVGFLSGLLTTTFTFALMWLSLRYVMFNYDEYVSTEGQGGLFIGLDVPKYLCFAALPLSFAFMTVRFGVRAVRSLRGEVEQADPLADLLEQGGAGGGPELGRDRPVPSEIPSEIPTEVSGVPVREPKAVPSEIPTEVIPVSGDDVGDGPGPLERRDDDAPERPSDIPTDPHRVVAGKPDGSPSADGAPSDDVEEPK